MKHFFVFLMMSLALSGFAEEVNTGNKPGETITFGDKIAEVENILKSVEGYVFLELGKDKARDLAKTFDRTDKVVEEAADHNELRGMDWETQNPQIAKVDENGLIYGLSYGQTLLTLKNGDKNHYFIVFVCPTVTVISPDGVIYTHQKVYNEKMKVDFSQSDDYVINSVMATYKGQSYDVTDKIDESGHYESSTDQGKDLRITSDVIYTITLEKEAEDLVVSKSPYRFLVAGGRIQLVSADSAKQLAPADINNLEVKVTVMKNQSQDDLDMQEVIVYNWTPLSKYVWGNVSDGVAELDFGFSEGIYNISLFNEEANKEYTYKIIVKYLD